MSAHPIWKILALAAVIPFTACETEAPEAPEIVRPVRTVEIGKGGNDASRTFSGISRAADQTNLSFRVAGLLSDFNVKLGATIKKGDLIAALDSSDLQLQAHQASSGLAQSSASQAAAQAEFERIRKLYESNSASRSQYDQARSSAKQASASVQSSRKQLQLAKNKVRYAELKAPSDGTVASLAAKAGENVAAGQTILILAQGGDPEVLVNVASIFIGEIQLGDAVSVTFPDLKDLKFQAVVQEIGVTPEEQQTTFPVVVRMQNPTKDVRLGLTAKVEFPLKRSEETQTGVRVPSAAVSEDANGRFVYLADETKEGFATVRRTAVETEGEPTSEGLLVTQGVSPGDRVITAGVSRVTEGQNVRLLSEGK